MQPFETSRLNLRDPRMTDRQPLTEMWTDAAVAQFMADYGPRDPASVQEWLTQIVRAADDRRQSSPSSVQLTLARKEDGVVVGWLGLGASSRGVADWDFGYAVHPGHRGNGYAAEALAGAVDGCRRRFGIESFWGECHQTNAASARVMTTAGFSEIAPSDDGNRRFVFRASRALTSA
ncbi:N-acetyltransferase [Microlunatus endophyticus]|uniref:N-acetyltransferase n=1 Tax=Microlunatus endophyticus TaxID=1716077 RepID=A0A917SBU4_9ACTN|nr:GNAT family N-acetyltransferase [Microlunatus endophyticus]GGL70479.1 N-acetyltransferase [Microlunatus endophyticus]